jgi:hypothetical protein
MAGRVVEGEMQRATLVFHLELSGIFRRDQATFQGLESIFSPSVELVFVHERVSGGRASGFSSPRRYRVAAGQPVRPHRW